MFSQQRAWNDKETIQDASAASAGDNHLFSEIIPAREDWKILHVDAMNATTVCSVRLEILDPEGRVQIIKTINQMQVTNFGGLEWTGEIILPSRWTVRVLLAYCQTSDAIAGTLTFQRRRRFH